ncbi:cytochrome P450 [Aspergillus neoniger CBS 115656]|uniref:Cytochrome P450 monooxygenase n=1 Tax=Aspergillus neoniger (strain CBS 115656) TaxID=1448310 RepID=A0A318ZG79_ASPNB|nr:cytochrome P450 monooxygenase [Aspergillus neoniger CBS 115656]PYH35082.1 cytochrome P450 monooxygenase [Aspergillus neoniger CBS 115656]
MAEKQFYLRGQYDSAVCMIEVGSKLDIHAIREKVASQFAIIEPKGISFHLDGEDLSSTEDILAVNQPIGILVDGETVHDVPGPKGLSLLGSHCEVYPDHIGNHQRLFELYGPIFQTTVMGRVVYHTNDPVLTAHAFAETEFFTKDINHAHPLYGVKSAHAGIFLTNTATKEWKEGHKFIVPAFSPKAIAAYTPRMEEVVRHSFPISDEMDQANKAWNAYSFMLKLSSQLVGELIIGADFRHFERVDSPIHDIPKAIVKLLGLNNKVTSWGDWYTWLPSGDPKRLRDTWHLVGSLVEGSVKKAPIGEGHVSIQEAGLKTQSLADYLVRARDSKGNKLSDESRNPALIVALTVGFVTTSSLLSWLIYGLVTYSGVQEKLLQELIDNNMTETSEMTGEFIGNLSYLDKFVKETQRRHTTSFQPARTARKDVILPGGYRVPKDGVVISEIHHLHNNPAIWDNPTQFSTDRWDTERVKNRHRGAYVPFAMGPRMCVATNFVAREVKVFIAMLVYRYEFFREGNDPIEYDSMFQTIKPSNLYVRARRRSHK